MILTYAMEERATPWQRLKGPGMYPVEYAAWLLNPLRYLIVPPGRIADRLQLLPTDRVLEVGCGPGFFSPAIARRLTAGHLTLLRLQPDPRQFHPARTEPGDQSLRLARDLCFPHNLAGRIDGANA